MNIDWLNLIVKIVTLLFLSAASQASFHKRLWATGFLCLAIWVTVFRLALLRSVAIYAGIFGKESPALVGHIRGVLQGGGIANVTDGFILVGAVIIFMFIAMHRYKLPK